jgi:CRISPR-associated protein Cmr1
MRTIPKQAPPQIVHQVRQDDVRTYRFLTPVFGGGVKLKESDPVTPVRVASIRGQLRFWWRAVNLHGYATLSELRSAEETVFGSTDKPSPLVVCVKKQPAKPTAFPVLRDGTRFAVEKGMDAISYGAFPLRATDEPFQHGQLSNFGGELFELVFSYPDAIKRDVDAALWAWAHFGALGGRTRRGFGAIAQVSPALPTIDVGWADFVKAEQVPWPHLEEKPAIAPAKSGENDGMAALERLLGVLRKLRQGPNMGRRTGQGRSFWPEPDAIRHRFPMQVGEKHRTRVTDQDSFPRAAFGTPIIFHFKQPDREASREEKEYAKDPRDSTLVPKGKHRLASRLLLRPHLGMNGQVEAMALVLAHPPADGGYVLQQELQEKEIPVSVSLKEPVSLGDRRAFTDPIQRFLEELRK